MGVQKTDVSRELEKEVLDDVFVDLMSEAIKRAEGDPLYGVRSIPVDTPAQAKRITMNSVRNNYRRWVDAGKPDTFVDFMQRRWAPIDPEHDPEGLNENWAPNIKSILKQMDPGSREEWKQNRILD